MGASIISTPSVTPAHCPDGRRQSIAATAGEAAWPPAASPSGALGHHHLGRLDHGDDGISRGQIQLLGTIARDRRRQHLAFTQHGLDRRHDLAVVDRHDPALELIASAQSHLGGGGEGVAPGQQRLLEEATNGASIFSYQNNHLSANVSDGAPTGTLTLK